MLTVKEGSAVTGLLAVVADITCPSGHGKLPATGAFSSRDAVS